MGKQGWEWWCQYWYATIYNIFGLINDFLIWTIVFLGFVAIFINKENI